MAGGIRRWSAGTSPDRVPLVRRPRWTAAPVLEPLEGRQLLSGYTGFSSVRNIITRSGIYNLTIGGPGILKTGAAGGGMTDLKVLGTSADSTLTITQLKPRFHVPNQLLSIRNLTIKSGQIGSINASPVELDGTMTPLTSSVNTIQFGGLGPAAQIDVVGSLGSMSLGNVMLGPTGHVVIAGNVSGLGTGTTTNTGGTATGTGTSTVTINGTVTGTITASGSGTGHRHVQRPANRGVRDDLADGDRRGRVPDRRRFHGADPDHGHPEPQPQRRLHRRPRPDGVDDGGGLDPHRLRRPAPGRPQLVELDGGRRTS